MIHAPPSALKNGSYSTATVGYKKHAANFFAVWFVIPECTRG